MTPTLARAVAAAEETIRKLEAEGIKGAEIVSGFGIALQRRMTAAVAEKHPEKVEVAQSIFRLIGAIGRATAKGREGS